ncbi:multidrug effflux MFS transporter [Geitlerinema splendidum]|jgi:DHA1 family bicyclomycin/chloramphenicol resistance-like MFS transporter|nr:multidrug effflux MFS transporter [Geitlerinema splendidum]
MKQSLSKGMVLVTIILMDILSGMEFDLFVPSFPELQDHFSLSAFWVEALLSVNFAGYCLSLFFVGGLADHYGRKPIIVMGLLIFILGTLLCLWAPSFGVMLSGRFLQGVGVSAPSILSFLIIADAYPLKKQQSLFATLDGLFNFAAGAAPVLGSYITLYFHWQGNFMTLLFLGLVAFVMSMLFIPAHKLPEHKITLSFRGYIPLFKSKPLMLLIMHIVFGFVPYWVFVGMSPLLYMEDLGVSLTHFGYYQGALAFIFAIGSLSFGFIVGKYDQKKMLYLSSFIRIIGLIMISLVSFLNSQNPLVITLAFLPFIVGGIIPSVILQPLCLNFMPQAKGRVSAILQGGRLVFASVCLQLAGYFYQGSFRNIGIIISAFILLTVMTLFFVIKNRELMEFSQE